LTSSDHNGSVTVCYDTVIESVSIESRNPTTNLLDPYGIKPTMKEEVIEDRHGRPPMIVTPDVWIYSDQPGVTWSYKLTNGYVTRITLSPICPPPDQP